MKCLKCGAQNDQSSKVCVKCGSTLENVEQQTSEEMNDQIKQGNEMTNRSAETQSTAIMQEKKTGDLNFVMYIVTSIMKPFENFKEKEEKLCDTKTSIILGAIVAVSMMVINLLSSMISSIFTKSYFSSKTTIDFSNLKDLNYLSLIFKNLFVYAAVIAVIALVYYLASLVVKKSVSYTKFLSITATSMIPFVISSMIVSPILAKIWVPLSVIVTVAGAVYAILIFIYLVKENIVFDTKDKEIYFNLVCMSILGSAGYYVYLNVLTSGISKQLLDYFS